MHLDAWLPRAAALYPEREALGGPEGSCSYAELHAAAQLAARRLSALGAVPGDRVALVLPPGRPFVETLHGCLLLGAVPVAVDSRLAEPELVARAAGAAVTVAEPLTARPADQVDLPEEHDAEAIATVVHTSGTTAAPRAIALTYGNWTWSALSSATVLGLDPAERWLCTLPLSHVGGLSILIRSAIYATTAVVHPRFDAEAVVRTLHEDAITAVSLVPTMLARLLDAGLERPPALRFALVGGGPIPPALLERARAAGVPTAPTYGLTEACSQVATAPPDDHASGAVPLPGTRVRVDDDGEILVHGPTVAPASLADDGWLHTGDLGRVSDDGRLTVTGRRADTVITGGENVAPAEVEAVLLEHPAVADAAVAGRADPEWGEAVVAAVVLHSGAEAGEQELREHCSAALAAFKVPKAITFVDELARTDTGKLRRTGLALGNTT